MSAPSTAPTNTGATSPGATDTDGDISSVSASVARAAARCGPFWQAVVVALTVAGIVLTLSQVFFVNPFGRTLLISEFLYLLLAAFLPVVFLTLPANPARPPDRVPPLDVALAAVALLVAGYFAWNGELILTEGWDYVAPAVAVVAAFVLWLLVLETLRRAAGWAVTGIAAAFSLYPLVAGGIPVPVLEGIQYSLTGVAQQHAMGTESVLGLPLQTAATILIGFLLFGVVLQHTGGGAFFYDFARSVFGTARGGSAKVSVASSAFLGMLSGSAVSNVLTAGPMTIPAMRRSGFSARYAAGVESTASTGGSITPPIMGTAAFLMVAFVGVPYTEIALAATIPAVLFFVGIYAQVDAYSARRRLRGVPRAELPALGPVLARGWPFILSLAVLLFLLVAYRRESQAPFWVVAGLLAFAALRRTDRLTPRRLATLLFGAGRTIAEIIGIIAGVGLIIGALSMTGVSLSLAREMVTALGGSLALVLIAGALTSFVLGLGMTVSAVYVLLASVMAPALVELGIDPIAAHLFVIYWATVSFITPPVALAAFAAAGIAGSRPMPTSLVAMRLGVIMYVVPFCFALNPALIGRADPLDVVVSVAFALLGVVVMASAFEGYLPGVERTMSVPLRVVAFVAGFVVLLPEPRTSLLGLGVVVVVAVLTRLTGRRPDDDPLTATPPPERDPAAR